LLGIRERRSVPREASRTDGSLLEARMKGARPSVLAFFRRTTQRSVSQLDGVPIWLALPAISLAACLLASQARTLVLPILGEHRWREADTYAVAYNFAHESFDFFHPRMDLTRGRSGITGMEPPILPFVMALAMRVFGDAPSVGRTIVWLTSMLGLVALLALVRRVRDNGLAIAFLFAFALSPLALFELRQIQPDGPTGMIAAIAAFFLFRFARLERRRDYLLGIAAYGLAVLMKGPGIALAPAMWWFACAARRVSLRQFVRRGVGVGVAVALYFPWYRWAHYLTNAYNAGMANFGIDFTVKGIKTAFVDEGRLHNVFWFLYPCYVTNCVLFPALLVGLPAAFQHRTQRVSAAFLLWLLFGSLFLAAFSPHLDSHWYYANLVLVPVSYFVGFGVSEVFRLFARGPRRAQPLVARWAALVVLMTLVLQGLIGDAAGASGAHPDGSWMSEGHLTTLLCTLALTMILAQQISWSWHRATAAALLPFAVYFGIGRATHNALDVLLWRSRRSEEGQFRQRWFRTLRPAVDRYSTRADLFVVNISDTDGTIPQDPFVLYLPLRKGWSEGAETIEKNGFAYYRHAGARFFLTYSTHPLPEEGHLAKLAETSYFRFYCLDPEGCNPVL
jgi:4-amino-4-deoxy-L-arabinose transferase-like glycosyltransferase